MSDFMTIQDTYRGFTTLLRHHYRGGHSYVVLKGDKQVLSSGPQPYGIEQAIHAMHRHIDRWIEVSEADAEIELPLVVVGVCALAVLACIECPEWHEE